MIIGLYAQDQQKKISLTETNYDSIREAYIIEKFEKNKCLRDSVRIQLQSIKADSTFSLNISNYYFKEMPDLSGFTGLKSIKADANLIKIIEKKHFRSDSLSRLKITVNQINKINFPRSKSIKHIDLSSNNLKRIPHSIRKLKNLEVLTLSNNQIRRIPGFVRRLKNLKEIDLSGNKIELNKSSVRRIKNIENVLLGNNNIEQLPENIAKMINVKRLNLAGNELSDLPSGFAKLKNLEQIIFYKNKFTQIPSQIFELNGLTELDFYYNMITEIPDGVGNLIKLEQLFLSHNNISLLNDTIRQLKQLRYLFIHHNELVMIPAWIVDLQDLERLDVGYNNIFEIPDLSELNKLTDLDLQSNNIENFPWSILDNEGLTLFLVNDNPLILTMDEKEGLKVVTQEYEKRGLRFSF